MYIIYQVELQRVIHIQYCFAVRWDYRISPNYDTAIPGETFWFRCFSDGNVVWKFNDGDIQLNAFPSDQPNRKDLKLLRIDNVQLYNTGIYTCYGRTKEKHYFEAQGFLRVIRK